MKASILEEQTDHLLGGSLMEEDTNADTDHLDALAEKLADKEPSDFLKMDDGYINDYIVWMSSKYDKTAIQKRMAVHESQSEKLRSNAKANDAKIDKQDVLYELCDASIGVLDGKSVEKMVKKVKAFIKERSSFKD